MAKKSVNPEKYQVWIEARRRYHLSDAQIQMARELGLNPRKFGKISNEKQEPWKIPLPEFIEAIYLKRFHKSQPDVVQSLEEVIKAQQEKQAEKKARKAELKDKSTSNDSDASSPDQSKLWNKQEELPELQRWLPEDSLILQEACNYIVIESLYYLLLSPYG